MSEELNNVIQVSIKLEEKLKELYARFAELHPEDSELWNSLMQENNHNIKLLENAITTPSGSVLANRLHDLREMYKVVTNKVIFYKNVKDIDKTQIFEDAIELEDAKSTLHLDIVRLKSIGRKTLKPFLFAYQTEKKNRMLIKNYIFNRKAILTC